MQNIWRYRYTESTKVYICTLGKEKYCNTTFFWDILRWMQLSLASTVPGGAHSGGHQPPDIYPHDELLPAVTVVMRLLHTHFSFFSQGRLLFCDIQYSLGSPRWELHYLLLKIHHTIFLVLKCVYMSVSFPLSL